MSFLTFFLWFANMIVDTGGQLCFKAAASRSRNLAGAGYWKALASRPWLWIGIIFYIAEFFVWMAFLSQVELSVGIMLGSINIVAIMLAGRILFREHLHPWRAAGILLITCGVAVVGLGE
jgi:multidrug transporter EmrE-like cation transporter